jgi:hypothetical protein
MALPGRPRSGFPVDGDAQESTTRYQRALTEMAQHGTDLAHRRITAASMRILGRHTPNSGSPTSPWATVPVRT